MLWLFLGNANKMPGRFSDSFGLSSEKRTLISPKTRTHLVTTGLPRNSACHDLRQVPKTLSIAIVAAAGVAIVTGCARSGGEVTTAGASGHSKPGFVRLLNLSSEDASMVDRGRQMVPSVPANMSSSFTTFPSGERTLQIKGNSADLNLKMDMKPGASALIVLGSNGRTSSTIEDARVPQNGHNLKLIYLDSDGSLKSSGPSVTLSNSGTHVVLSAKEPAATVSEGSWTVSANDLRKAETLAVVPNTTYDLVLVKGNRGHYFEVVLSHLFIEKGKLAGMAKMN
jgi:hypothetical protein